MAIRGASGAVLRSHFLPIVTREGPEQVAISDLGRPRCPVANGNLRRCRARRAFAIARARPQTRKSAFTSFAANPGVSAARFCDRGHRPIDRASLGNHVHGIARRPGCAAPDYRLASGRCAGGGQGLARRSGERRIHPGVRPIRPSANRSSTRARDRMAESIPADTEDTRGRTCGSGSGRFPSIRLCVLCALCG
jgi:hypothetical protein